MSKDEAEKGIAAIWGAVASSGISLSAVPKEVRTDEENAAACRAFGQFFAKIAAIPAPKTGALMRYLLANTDK